ncbi:MAG TPA: M50 family metallopeptidase [Abditibacteriaceae bacterium]|jgi:regulator of sigma E protease
MPEETKKKFDPTLIIMLVVAAMLAVRAPEFLKGVVIFVVTLSVLVFVHEWGHYQFARWAGMKVNRFALGFPPWVYTKRYKGIDYSVGALPIGGMVDIAGLGSEEEMVATAKNTGDSTAANATPVYERRPDRPFGERQFQDSSLGWRFMTLFAGPMMNFIYALIVFIGLFSLVGVPNKITRTNTVEVVQPGMPAFRAGLEYGDKIVGVNDTKTSDVDVLIKTISGLNGKPVKLMVERDGKILQKNLQPIVEQVEKFDKEGNRAGFEKASRIGIGFLIRVDSYKKLSTVEAVQTGVAYATGGARAILGMLGRAVTGNMSSAEVRDVGGPVKIGQAVNLMAKKGWFEVLLGSGALSLNLGLLNLLPLPALDGGRIMFLGYELVARKPVDPNKENMVNVVGMVMLLTFMLLITMRDVWPWLERGLRGLSS